jgi:site-specific DNA-methyltransferase (adenine-specific)
VSLKPNTLYCADCRLAVSKIETESVDLILTDPPYKKEFNWVWPWLAEEAPRILQPNGHLVTLLGHNQVPIAIEALSKTLRYWWIGGLANKRSNKLFGKNVIIRWKPALWFIKGKRQRENEGYFPLDFISVEREEFADAKKHHAWGQPVPFFTNWIEHITKPGALILDPFAGGGTVALAARNLERDWILIENDRVVCKKAVERLGLNGFKVPKESTVTTFEKLLDEGEALWGELEPTVKKTFQKPGRK